MQSRKVLKLLLILGLLIIPLVVAVVLLLSRKTPMGLLHRAYIWCTKYRKLLPYVIAQAKFETENFSSYIYRTHNNAFGMKHPEERKAVGEKGMAASDGGYYQKYKSVLQSIHDLFLWMDAKRFPVEVGGVEQYTTELQQRGYFTSPWDEYTNGLKSYIK